MVSPVKVIAGCAGLCGFTVAVLAGLAADNPMDVILGRAIVANIACYLVGGVIGYVMDRAVDEGIEQYKSARPTPLSQGGALSEGEAPVEVGTRPDG